MTERCPLCGSPNDCAMAAGAADATGCWCSTAQIAKELREHVPREYAGACICQSCVAQYRQQAGRPTRTGTGIPSSSNLHGKRDPSHHQDDLPRGRRE
jgi:hypothetical protein